MREIKFRAWDAVDSLMYQEVQNGIAFEDGSHYKFSDFIEKNGYFEWSIMQYTGLKDKNGVEIYEGDILRTPLFGDDEEEYDDEEKSYLYRQVLFSERKACWIAGSTKSLKDEIEFPLWPAAELKESIVIGNIHENPELLENERD